MAISTQSGTSYTLVLGDAGSLIQYTNAGAVTLTLPTNASVALPIGTTTYHQQTTSGGKVGVVGASGVTVNSAGGFTHTNVQWSVVAAIKTATNTWVVTGDRA